MKKTKSSKKIILKITMSMTIGMGGGWFWKGLGVGALGVGTLGVGTLVIKVF